MVVKIKEKQNKHHDDVWPVPDLVKTPVPAALLQFCRSSSSEGISSILSQHRSDDIHNHLAACGRACTGLNDKPREAQYQVQRCQRKKHGAMCLRPHLCIADRIKLGLDKTWLDKDRQNSGNLEFQTDKTGLERSCTIKQMDKQTSKYKKADWRVGKCIHIEWNTWYRCIT